MYQWPVILPPLSDGVPPSGESANYEVSIDIRDEPEDNAGLSGPGSSGGNLEEQGVDEFQEADDEFEDAEEDDSAYADGDTTDVEDAVFEDADIYPGDAVEASEGASEGADDDDDDADDDDDDADDADDADDDADNADSVDGRTPQASPTRFGFIGCFAAPIDVIAPGAPKKLRVWTQGEVPIQGATRRLLDFAAPS
jgi:hypothetical protein